jgi:RimJ/RimL family protein N-acetyltransferase
MMRTGADFREVITIGDGTVVTLRHVRPEDAAELQRAFERLSPESRYRRFFGGMARLSDEAVRYLTEVDGHDHVAIVATYESPDLKGERGVGVARFVRMREEPAVAEAAITVVDDMQRKGLGRALAIALTDAARERGVRTFRADVLADNEPMLAILRDVGATERARGDGVVTYDVAIGETGTEGAGVVARLLREAARTMGVLVRRLGPPAP